MTYISEKFKMDADVWVDFLTEIGSEDHKYIQECLREALVSWVDARKDRTEKMAQFHESVLKAMEEEKEGKVCPLSLVAHGTQAAAAWAQTAPPLITVSGKQDIEELSERIGASQLWLDQFVDACRRIERPESRGIAPLYWCIFWDNIVIKYLFADGRVTILRIFDNARRYATLTLPLPRNPSLGSA